MHECFFMAIVQSLKDLVQIAFHEIDINRFVEFVHVFFQIFVEKFKHKIESTVKLETVE